jgi:hypothetical protein
MIGSIGDILNLASHPFEDWNGAAIIHFALKEPQRGEAGVGFLQEIEEQRGQTVKEEDEFAPDVDAAADGRFVVGEGGGAQVARRLAGADG